MRKVFAVTLCVAIALLGMPGSILAASKTATAQVLTGTVKVVAKDSNNKPLAGATVNITNAAGEVVGTATTNAAGEAVFTLPVGTFNVSIVSGGVAVGAGTVTVVAGLVTTAAITTSVGAIIGGGGLFGLGALGTAGLIGGAGALGYLGYRAATNNASPSR
jgi:hypothetical protein